MYGGGGPVVDDSGVYSALPGTPPPWNREDYEDDQVQTVTLTDAQPAAPGTLSEFPRERLRFVDKLGEGLFGEVYRHYSFFYSMHLRTELLQISYTTKGWKSSLISSRIATDG